jgi:hypothetical protein
MRPNAANSYGEAAVMIRRVTQEQLLFGGKPITLIGVPRSCRGVLLVTNPHDGPVKLRRIRLRTSGELEKWGDGGAFEVPLVAVLPAGETRPFEITLRLPPGLRPGVYEAHLDAAKDSSVPVAVHVLEDPRMRLSPAIISCAASPGETFTVFTTALNIGNVTAVVPGLVAVQMHPTGRGWPEHLHGAIASEGEHGYEAVLNAFVKRLADDEAPVGLAKVLAGAGPLAPQESRVLEVHGSLSNRLRADFTYDAIVPLAGASLRLTLRTGVAKETDGPEGDVP